MDRRQRQREATMGEIRTVARRQLAETGAAGLSLRAVAREMGLTAPALYRYYDDRDALLTALIVDAYGGLNSVLEHARDARPESDHVGRMIAACLAWRQWAVARPHEFALVFGAPVPGYEADVDGPTEQAGQRFGGIFLELFASVYAESPFVLPPREHLTPELEGALSVAGLDAGPALPGGAMQLFLSGWSTLHGLISLEVFGHMGWVGLPDPEALYRAEVAGLTARMGLDATRAQHQPSPLARTA